MIEPRSIDEIQEQYFAAIANSGSGLLIDNSEGSLAYTLSRASAVVISSLEESLIVNNKDTTLINATGKVLDSIAEVYLKRELEVPARGYVLAQPLSDSVTLPFDTRLFTLDEGQSYRVMESPSITLRPTLQTPIRVEAVNAGSQGNIIAGALMFSPTLSNVVFKVGISQQLDNIVGDISGGRDLESDDAYRRRVIQFLTQGPYSSTQYIENKLLEYPNVERAFVYTPAPGVCEIWVDSSSIVYTENQVQELYNYISPYLTLGVIPLISQARRKPVDINLDIIPYRAGAVSFDALSLQIREVIKAYIQRLRVGQTLLLSELYSLIRPLVSSLSITKPADDVTSTLNEIIVAGVIRVNYSIGDL